MGEEEQDRRRRLDMMKLSLATSKIFGRSYRDIRVRIVLRRRRYGRERLYDLPENLSKGSISYVFVCLLHFLYLPCSSPLISQIYTQLIVSLYVIHCHKFSLDHDVSNYGKFKRINKIFHMIRQCAPSKFSCIFYTLECINRNNKRYCCLASMLHLYAERNHRIS